MFRLFKRDAVTQHDRDIAARGIRANDFLKHPAYAEVMEALEDYFWSAFMETAPDNYEARELLHTNINNLRAIQHRLETWVSEGEFAQIKLDEEEQ